MGKESRGGGSRGMGYDDRSEEGVGKYDRGDSASRTGFPGLAKRSVALRPSPYNPMPLICGRFSFPRTEPSFPKIDHSIFRSNRFVINALMRTRPETVIQPGDHLECLAGVHQHSLRRIIRVNLPISDNKNLVCCNQEAVRLIIVDIESDKPLAGVTEDRLKIFICFPSLPGKEIAESLTLSSLLIRL